MSICFISFLLFLSFRFYLLYILSVYVYMYMDYILSCLLCIYSVSTEHVVDLVALRLSISHNFIISLFLVLLRVTYLSVYWMMYICVSKGLREASSRKLSCSICLSYSTSEKYDSSA